MIKFDYMKLFLTSAGLNNNLLVKAFNDLVGLSNEEIKIAFVPTAANVEEGDKDWLINDYKNLKAQNYTVDIVDISAVPEKIWRPRLEASNVLFFGGGNTFHLIHWIEISGLQKILPELLETKVYAGISAGSCVAGPTVNNSVLDLFGEKNELEIKNGLSLVDFQLIPHLNSDFFPKIRDEYLIDASKDLIEPVYAIDDNSAVVVNGDKLEVVSQSVWKKYN